MPSKTPKQARAMKAAASGKSKIGIPKKVGQEFTKADKKMDKGSKFKEGSKREEAMDAGEVSTKGGNSFPLKGRKAFGGL